MRPGRSARRLRPTTFGRSLLLVIVLAGYVALEGQPALLAVAALLTGVLAVTGTVWPVVTVARAALSVSGPTDAIAGGPVTYRVAGERLGDGVEVRLVGGPWVPVVGPGGRAVAEVTRDRVARGVYVGAEVEVRASGPLGLTERTRSSVLALRAPLVVAPRPFPVELDADTGTLGADGSAAARSADSGESVRTVRPYAAGDPARLVHWPSTARTGELVVRELEPIVVRRIAVVADLSDGGPMAELTASAAAGAVAAALAQGAEVLLVTAEDGRPVVGRVGSTLGAGRRLAHASPGPMGAVPPGWGSVDVRAWVAAQRSEAPAALAATSGPA